MPARTSPLVACAAVAGLAALLGWALWIPWIHGADGVRNYVYCRSLFFDHDFDFTNEFAHYRESGEFGMHETDPRTGLPPNALGVGSAVLWSPFFMAGHLWARSVGAPADGYSAPYVKAVCFGSAAYGAAGLLLLLLVLLRRTQGGPWTAAAALAAVWLGTPLFFYMVLHPSMSHACSFFLCSLLVFLFDRWEGSPRPYHFFCLGLVSGLVVTTRFNDGVFLLLPAALFVKGALRSGRPGGFHGVGLASLGAVMAAAGFALAVFPQLFAWHTFHGSWLSGPRSYEIPRHLALGSSPHLIDVLVSARRGLFVWAPVLALSIAGFMFLCRKGRLLETMLGAAFLAHLWIIGGWRFWWGGASFGQRFFINFTPLFALGLAALFATTGRKGRIALMAVTACCVLWTVGLAVQYAGGLIDRQKPVSFSRLAANQVREVPSWLLKHAGDRLKGRPPAG